MFKQKERRQERKQLKLEDALASHFFPFQFVSRSRGMVQLLLMLKITSNHSVRPNLSFK